MKLNFSHKAEMNHTQKVLSTTGNPQGSDETNPQQSRKQFKKVNLYFGSYLYVAKESITQQSQPDPSNTKYSDFQKSMKSLFDRQTALENSIQTTVDTSIDTKLTPIKAEISLFKEASQGQLDTILSKIEGI